MNFNEALELLKEGKKVLNSEWPDNWTFLIEIKNWKSKIDIYDLPENFLYFENFLAICKYNYIVDKYCLVPWEITQEELFSDCWVEFLETQKLPIPSPNPEPKINLLSKIKNIFKNLFGTEDPL